MVAVGTDVAATRAVASWVGGLELDVLPADALERARLGVLDTVAVILAGLEEPAAQIAAEVVAEDRAAPAASQLGTGLGTSVEAAAFLNGVAGHALDYDDVSFEVQGHPSVVVLPAVLAVAEARRASGRDLLVAYVAGIEVMAKLSRAIGRQHYEVGWHATATIGTIAAAAAVARLLRLDPERVAHTLAIAASEASGSRQNFGTMTKPFHAGHAARCGVHAARLAERGFTGDPTILEAPLGFFALFGQGVGRPEAVGPALGRPFELASPGIGLKRYPCCYGVHRALDGVLDLAAAQHLESAAVTGVTVWAPPGELVPLIHPRPRTGLEGKFSMEYCVAAALLDGAVSLDTFEDARVQRPEAQRLLALVEVREDDRAGAGLAGGEGEVQLEVRLRDGRRLEQRVRRARGAPGTPISARDVIAKLQDCARGVLDDSARDRAVEQILMLERVEDVSGLVRTLARPAAEAPAR